MLKRLGYRLKKAREQIGLTQNQVAQVLEISREQVSYYEGGKREMGVNDLLKFADVYGLPPEYFLELEEDMTQKPTLVAYRTAQLSGEDLPVILDAQMFLNNLHKLDLILEKAGVQ